jgi:hypothetical protein
METGISEDMEECSHILVVGQDILHLFEHELEGIKTNTTKLTHIMMMQMVAEPDAFEKMQNRILETMLPSWMEMEEDHESSDSAAMLGHYDSTAGEWVEAEFSVAYDMCHPDMSLQRATDVALAEECIVFEATACMEVEPTNVTIFNELEGIMAFEMCARALGELHPQDDGILESCLENSAATPGGMASCLEAEMNPLLKDYLLNGEEVLTDMEFYSMSGHDFTHLMKDKMLAMTMDPEAKVEANVMGATYRRVRRLMRERRLGEEDCLNINGKKYCNTETSARSTAPQNVPPSNGKRVQAHKYFTRKNRARKLRSAHKHLMRHHRKLSRSRR